MKTALTVIIAIVVVLAIAFGALYLTTDITPVSALREDPTEYRDREVMLLGEVANRFAYGEDVVFELEDATGSIAVHVTGEAPAKGDKVVAKGVVRSAIAIGDHEFGILLEANEIRTPYFWENLAAPGAPKETTTTTVITTTVTTTTTTTPATTQ